MTLTTTNLAHYQTYFEFESEKKKPKLDWRIKVDFNGKRYKGIVVEVGKTILCKVVS